MLEIKNTAKTSDALTHQKTVKVLVVSKENENYLFIKTLVGESPYSQHYKFEWIDNYPAAINAMLKKHYDLYLLDFKLGDHSGLALLHEAICSNCTDPIIMFSNKADVQADREALRIGAASYLVKENMDGNTLERAMRYALEQNVAWKTLKKNESKFRVLFERSKYPILITDSSGKIYDANAAAVKFFQLPLEKLLAENDNTFYPVALHRDRFIRAMEDNGAVNDMEQELRLPDGQTKFCSISSFVQISQHATSVLYYSIIDDLTTKKEHETDLAEKIAISEHLVKNLAAELQNPLTNLNLALLELTASLQGNNDTLKMYVDIVKENLGRIDELTKNLFVSAERSLGRSAGRKMQ